MDAHKPTVARVLEYVKYLFELIDDCNVEGEYDEKRLVKIVLEGTEPVLLRRKM